MSYQSTTVAVRKTPCCVEFPPRQHEILALIADGLGDKEIALRLGVTPRTIRTHLERLYSRYDLHSRSAAVALWLREQRAA